MAKRIQSEKAGRRRGKGQKPLGAQHQRRQVVRQTAQVGQLLFLSVGTADAQFSRPSLGPLAMADEHDEEPDQDLEPDGQKWPELGQGVEYSEEMLEYLQRLQRLERGGARDQD